MTVIAQSVLETASFVDWEPELVGVQSDQTDGVVLTHVGRPDRPERGIIRLRWRDAPPALADAISNHYLAQVGSFSFRARTGEDIAVVYAEPPSFQPRSAASVDVTVVLEQAFDSD